MSTRETTAELPLLYSGTQGRALPDFAASDHPASLMPYNTILPISSMSTSYIEKPQASCRGVDSASLLGHQVRYRGRAVAP